jgi:ribosomal protein S26
MISSPCKNCSKRNLPKEKCVKECKLLQAIQDMELTTEKLNDGSSIDYTEEYSYNFSLRRSMASF